MFPNGEHWLEPYVPPPGRVALDVGANEGQWTAMLSPMFEEVHCFDPNPQIREKLRTLVSSLPNVSLSEMAIGSGVGRIQFNLYNGTQYASIDERREGIIETIDVPFSTIDHLGFAKLPIDFIKIDTEGSEVDILYGAMKTLKANHPRLIIEIHTWDNLGLCQEALIKAGYDNAFHLPHPLTDFKGHSWLIVA